MIKSYFDISGIKVCLESQAPFNNPKYSVFLVKQENNMDIKADIHVLELKDSKENGLESAVFSFKENNLSWYITRDGGMAIAIPPGVLGLNSEFYNGEWHVKGNSSFIYLYANKDFSYVEYEGVEHTLPEIFFSVGGEVIHRYHIIFRGGMVMHAVSINYKGESILFSGVSGMGKSTQADLWSEFEGSHIINGDRATLQFQDERLITTGSAWSGSSGIFLNESAPIKAIVFLEQADYNQLVELAPQKALSYMMPRCFLPYYNQEFMAIALSNVDKIARNTRMFLLRNKADRESVELVRQAVFGG